MKQLCIVVAFMPLCKCQYVNASLTRSGI